jgi:DNA mismatch endonuclease (patch repair protein)
MTKTPEQRSRTMRAVKSVDTSPEMAVRSMAHRMGLRFRLYRKDLPGKPDLVFPRLHKVIFVHGCFWHGHDCLRARRPKTNVEYWSRKIARNHSRDVVNSAKLMKLGWMAGVIWECELKKPEIVRKRLARFLR